MENRKSKQAKLKQGPGVFTYIGGAFDTEWIPTVLKTSKQEAAVSDDGSPIYDRAGRPVMVPAGRVVRNDKGEPMMGGPPKVVRNELKTYTLRKIEFPKGEPVEVFDEALALKLRGLDCFDEAEDEIEDAEPGKQKSKKQKRKYQRRAAPVASAEADTSAEG